MLTRNPTVAPRLALSLVCWRNPGVSSRRGIFLEMGEQDDIECRNGRPGDPLFTRRRAARILFLRRGRRALVGIDRHRPVAYRRRRLVPRLPLVRHEQLRAVTGL